MTSVHIYISSTASIGGKYSINQGILPAFTMFQGQADLLFKSQTECEPPLHLLEFRVTQRKYNRTVNVLDIIVNTPYDIGDDLTVSSVLNIQSKCVDILSLCY